MTDAQLGSIAFGVLSLALSAVAVLRANRVDRRLRDRQSVRLGRGVQGAAVHEQGGNL